MHYIFWKNTGPGVPKPVFCMMGIQIFDGSEIMLQRNHSIINLRNLSNFSFSLFLIQLFCLLSIYFVEF